MSVGDDLDSVVVHVFFFFFFLFVFFFNDTATTEIYTLSLHDALPISHYNSWKWWILDPNYDQDGNSNNPYSVAQSTIGEDANPLYGQNPIVCIPQGDLFQYGFLVAKHMAIQHAQEIKTDREFQIYTVGLGDENPDGPFALDPEFLRQISSGPEFSFLANNSTDLTALFLEIANRIKLVLIE